MGYNNFVRCQLSASITSADTSITLSSNTSPFNLPPTDGGTLVLADSINKPSKLEIITYTSRSGLVLTGVVRGAESTTAQSWPSSSYCYMSFTALMLTSFKADMSAALQTVVNKQDKHTNLTALSGITSGTGLFKRASDGSWVLDTTQYSTVTLASAIPLAGSISGSVGTSFKAAKEDHTHPLQTSVSGNAGTATKLASPISFTFTGGATGSLSSFDGSGNVTINLTVDAGGHTHGLASSLINGLMSSAQFTKLAGIADNANNYIHPVGAGYSHIPAAGTNVNRFLKSGTNDTYSWSLLSKTDVGLSNVDNTSDADKPLSTAVINALLNKVNTSLVGVAGGLATLDTNTKVPSSQLPNASSSIYGVVKLPTDTTNTITANALSSVSNRTYQIQKSTDGGLVVNIPWTDTIYTHPVSGVTTGSYTKVTVDVNGHVIGGSNPTTLTGYGITDATPSSHIGSTGTSHGVASTSVNGFMSTSQVVSLNTAISDISTLQTTVAGKEPSFSVLPVNKGGTGASSLSGVLKGNGTSQLSAATSNDIVALVPDATTSQAGKMTTSQVSSLNELGGLVSLGSGVVKKTLNASSVDTYSIATIADLVTSTNAVTNLNADMLDGLHVNHAGTTASAHIPFVGSNGVMEVGKFIDFHTVLGKDFELRLEAVAVTDSQSADLRVSGGRTASARVWHSDNHGANSGLDADKLDGNHASAFSLIGHTHDIATTSTAGFLSPANVEKLNALTVSRLLQVTTVDAPPVNTVHDLNNFISNGFFHHRLSSYASAGSNYPTPHAGMLKVIANDSMVYQLYHTYNNTGVYFRSKYNSSWYPWCKLFDTVNTTSNDIVALVPDATTIQAGKMTTAQVSSLNELGGLVSMGSGIVKKTLSTTGVDTYSTAAISDLVTSTNVVSSLNADMLDGLHVGSAASLSISHIPYVGSDGVIELGKYIDFHLAPGTDYDLRLTSALNKNGTANIPNLYLKGGSITSDVLIWHSGNVGAGSGLDADMLDGNHASAFALSDHTHGNATTSENGFMGSTDKSRIDLLNLSSTESLTKVAGIDATYSGIANLSRNGSRITLDIPNGATLTTHRSYKGGEFTCNTYLENSSGYIQATFGVVGYGNLYGGTSAPGHLAARVYGGYNVASVACTSDVNNYVYRMVGTYSGVSVDATKSKVSSIYGNFIELTGSGETTTTTGYVTNAYGLFINASSIDPYATNLYSIYCNESRAKGYLAGDLCIGLLNPNPMDGGLTITGQYLYLYKEGDTAGAYCGADSDGVIAGLASNGTHVLHTPYGFKFGEPYSTTRESADSQTLDWYEEASVTLTSSGLTTNTTATAKLTRNGNLVAIDVPTITGAGTSTTFKLTGIPIQFRPLVAKEFLVRGIIGGVVSICRAIINTSGEVQVYAGLNSETFSTTSSTRGINKISLSYQLH